MKEGKSKKITIRLDIHSIVNNNNYSNISKLNWALVSSYWGIGTVCLYALIGKNLASQVGKQENTYVALLI